MLYVVSYDVVDDRRRNKLADFLENFGVRVQYSVFEVELKEKEYNVMVKGIKKRIKPEEDTVRIYPIAKELKDAIMTIGLDKGQYFKSDVIVV
uniref:CRISPR-associated endoribonuclease Cas2 n=1 Tax=Pseudothermotoga hypogea TaxID=57487 RepID=A0A832I8V7_9THEM